MNRKSLLAAQVKMLPTPTTCRKGNKSYGPKAQYRPPLQEMAEKNTWPTPRASERGSYQYDQGDHNKPRLTLTGAVKKFPRVFMHKDSTTDRGKGNLGEVIGGQPNPTWVEWLMGFPLGWTDLEDSETP